MVSVAEKTFREEVDRALLMSSLSNRHACKCVFVYLQISTIANKATLCNGSDSDTHSFPLGGHAANRSRIFSASS